MPIYLKVLSLENPNFLLPSTYRQNVRALIRHGSVLIMVSFQDKNMVLELLVTKHLPLYLPSLTENECFLYTSRDTIDRSMMYTTYRYKCDSGMRAGWYRFNGPAGDAMPRFCVPAMRCGTHAPGWMTGQNPEVSNVT